LLPSGDYTVCYGKYIKIWSIKIDHKNDALPLKNGDFPLRYLKLPEADQRGSDQQTASNVLVANPELHAQKANIIWKCLKWRIYSKAMANILNLIESRNGNYFSTLFLTTRGKLGMMRIKP
jgi:hypothetical protein